MVNLSLLGTWVVDIGLVLDKYKYHEPLMMVFEILPLKTIIENILSVSYFIDYSDRLNDMLSPLDLDDYQIDMDHLELLIEGIILEIDDTIIKAIPQINEYEYYLFRDWLGSRSLVIYTLK